MPFNPHTPKDVGDMLAAIGAKSIEDLFDEIPKELRIIRLRVFPTRSTRCRPASS